MEGSDYPQSAASPQSMESVLISEGEGKRGRFSGQTLAAADSSLTSLCWLAGGGRRALPTVPGIPGGTRAGAGKIGRMIAEEVMEFQK